MHKLKSRLYDLVSDNPEKSAAGKTFDWFIVVLIILNVALIILDTFQMPQRIQTAANYFEWFSVVVFSVEYLLRLWTSDIASDVGAVRARVNYVFSFMAMVDLLAILPFYIPFLIPIDLRVLRTLRLIRLFRLFKINRYTSALSAIAAVLKNKASQLLSSIFIVFLLMLVSSVLMYSFENLAQPDVFKNAFSGLWWAVATFTTVGYGDIYPITVAGRILSSVVALLGIGLVAVPTGIISAGFIEHISSKEQCGEETKFCPYCGKHLS